MWAKFTNAIANSSRARTDADSTLEPTGVLTSVREQHPNLSVFNDNPDVPFPTPATGSSPPSSPRKGIFKRTIGRSDSVSRPASPSLRSMPRKVAAKLGAQLLQGNGSQQSLIPEPQAKKSMDTGSVRSFTGILRRSSRDMLRPRPSLDLLNQAEAHVEVPEEYEPTGSPFQGEFQGSVRSILREPNTPGTGQNVRFFSRDAYNSPSGEVSLSTDSDYPNALQQRVEGTETQINSSNATVLKASSPTHIRPPLAGLFSNMDPHREDTEAPSQNTAAMSLSDMSMDLELPSIPPPGLGIDLDLSSGDFMNSASDGTSGPMSSTPYRDSKGKVYLNDTGFPASFDGGRDLHSPSPVAIDESIFHPRSTSVTDQSASREHSRSGSVGQTVFFSMNAEEKSHRVSSSSSVVPSSIRSSASFSRRSSGASTSLTKATDSPASSTRSRALSDTVFMSMMRSSPATKNDSQQGGLPESDINDESCDDVVLYSHPEPDPFSATANTYYTPQTMIPITPPHQKTRLHIRKTSKEENAIVQLQTQLNLQTELVSQFEADIRGRDELLGVMTARLEGFEAEEARRKVVTKAWKKKVLELERLCRHLQDQVEASRHESMDRSVMDEASGEALRMLHRQISALEHEKDEWTRKEEILYDRLEDCEQRLDEKTREADELRETLDNVETSGRALIGGMEDAKDQFESLGNMSLGYNEEELKKIVSEAGKRDSVLEEQRAVVAEWRMKEADYVEQNDQLQQENASLRAELDNLRGDLKDKDEKLSIIQAELEAQWLSTEKSTERIQSLQTECGQLEKERETYKHQVEQLGTRVRQLESDIGESEKKRAELESELEQAWNQHDEAEGDRQTLEDRLRELEDSLAPDLDSKQMEIERLQRQLQERDDRLEDLEKQRRTLRQQAIDSMSHLETNNKQHLMQVNEYTSRIQQVEAEKDKLQRQLEDMRNKREDDAGMRSRELREVTRRGEEAKAQMDVAVEQKQAAEEQVRQSAQKIVSLQEEVDRIRRQVQELQQQSADSEVKLVQINKQRAKDMEDISGLNMALDSKQQELELMKRKFGLRGTAASTPAATGKTTHRRDSSMFATPTIPSRPSSVISDSGKDDLKRSTSSTSSHVNSTGKTPLVKSSRVNTMLSTSSSGSTPKPALTGTGSISKRIDGSMGPPPSAMRGRMSVAGTPTPLARPGAPQRVSSLSGRPASIAGASSLSRSTAAKAGVSSSTPTRKVDAKAASGDEKENTAKKRQSMLATPA